MKKLFIVFMLLAGVSAFAERAMIRGDGTLLVDGKPVFPVGYRAESLADVREGAGVGFNLVMGSGEWEEYQFDYAAAKGLWIIGGDCYLHFHGAQDGIDLSAREDAVISNFLQYTRDQHSRSVPEALEAFGNKPRVIGWIISDEPEAKVTEVAEAAYEVVKGYMPEKLVFSISCDVRWLPGYLNSADVLIYDRYLLQGTRENAESFYHTDNTLGDYLEFACKEWESKSLWYMPQLYQPSYFSLQPEDLLEKRDLRAQCYTAIICGAKGLLFYTWDALKVTYESENGRRKEVALTAEQVRQQLDMLREIVSEFKSLNDILCDGRPSREVFVNWVAPGIRGPGSIRHRILDYYGKYYLIVHNPLPFAVTGIALNADVNHANSSRNFTGKLVTGKEDIALSRRKEGMVQFTIQPHGCGVIELKRLNIIPRYMEK